MSLGRAIGAWGAAALVVGLAGCDEVSEGGAIRPVVQFGEVGKSPGQFSYPRGMDAGGGSLWIVDKLARVQRIDPSDGRSLGEWQMPDWALGKPTGVTVFDPDPKVDGDELIFMADTHYHRVMVYRAGAATRDGGTPSEAALFARFGSFGTGDGQFIYPTDVAVRVSDDGSRVLGVFVSEYGGNDRISEWTRNEAGEFVFVRAFGRFGDGKGEGLEFNRPQSIAFDAAHGELIVTDACNHRLVRVRVSDGAQAGTIGGPGTERGRFKYPYGLVLLGDATAVVAEFGNCRVQRVSLETGEGLETWGVPGRGPGELASPWGVAVMDDRLYVLDSGNNRVMGVPRPRRWRG